MSIEDLVEIKPGDKAQAQVLNENFSFLKDLITSSTTGLDSEIDSIIETLLPALSTKIDGVNDKFASYFLLTGGNKTVNGQVTFNNFVKVPNSSTNGCAIAQASLKKQGISQNSSGYWTGSDHLKLGDGILFQWGQHYFTAGRTPRTITLPEPYTNTRTFQPFVTGNYVTYNGNVSYGNVGAKVVAKNQITIYNERVESYPEYFHWFTIGY